MHRYLTALIHRKHPSAAIRQKTIKSTLMRKFALAIIVISAGIGYSYRCGNIVFADEKIPDNSMRVSEAVTDTTDVHYSGKYCTQCHEQTPRNGAKFLKYEGDFKQLCRCHYKTVERDLHPIGIEPSAGIRARMPKNYPLLNGKIACSTCHDIVEQCRDQKTYDRFDKRQKFLRGAPYTKQTDFCFKCHNKIKFKKYNPHEQLNASGDVIELTCLYCHLEIPDKKQAEFKDIKLIGNLDMLCDRCHNKAGEQSLHASHLRKPSAKVFASIKQLENKFGIILPLNEEGKITCATCHNPHQKGVIPAEKAGAKGADDKNRHRIPENICMQCHQMG